MTKRFNYKCKNCSTRNEVEDPKPSDVSKGYKCSSCGEPFDVVDVLMGSTKLGG